MIKKQLLKWMCSPVVWLIMTYYPMIRKTHFSAKKWDQFKKLFRFVWVQRTLPKEIKHYSSTNGFQKNKGLKKKQKNRIWTRGWWNEQDEHRVGRWAPLSSFKYSRQSLQTRGEDTNIQLNQRNLLFTASFMFQENVMLHFCRWHI